MIRYCPKCGKKHDNDECLFCRNPKCSARLSDTDDCTIQMIPAIVLPEPKPYYGLPRKEWESLDEDQRRECIHSYQDSVDALKSIYAQLLAPIAVVKDV